MYIPVNRHHIYLLSVIFLCVLDFRAMASASTWREFLAAFNALYDLVKFGSDYSTSFTKHWHDPDDLQEARRVSNLFTTNFGEIEEWTRKVVECWDRVKSQSSGEDRARSLCSLFSEIKAGHGGKVPPIKDWQRMYDELGCGSRD